MNEKKVTAPSRSAALRGKENESTDLSGWGLIRFSASKDAPSHLGGVLPHFSQRTREMGHPPQGRAAASKSRVRQRQQRFCDDLLGLFIRRNRVHRDCWILRTARRGKFPLDPDVNSVVSRVAQVLHSVLEGRIPSHFARLREHLAHLPVLIGETKMSFRQAHHHAARMLMERGFFVWAVVNRHYLHPIVLEVQFVVLRFNLGGVLCLRKNCRQTHKSPSPE